MHEVIRSSVTPAAALASGLEVDADALPASLKAALRAGTVVLPPALGLRHVKGDTYSGDGVVSCWNAYVAITRMHGHGRFPDPRIGASVNNPPDLVSSKLDALRAYRFSLEAPPPGRWPPPQRRGHARTCRLQHRRPVRILSPGRRTHRRHRQQAALADRIRSGSGPCVAQRDREVSHHAAARIVASAAAPWPVLPRRERRHAGGGRRSLHRSLQPGPDPTPAARPGAVPQDAVIAGAGGGGLRGAVVASSPLR